VQLHVFSVFLTERMTHEHECDARSASRQEILSR
jgi:hypothetical protein